MLIRCHRVAAKVGAYQAAFRACLSNGLKRGLADIVMGFVDIQQSIHTDRKGAVIQGDVTAVGEQRAFHTACQRWAGGLDIKLSTRCHTQVPQCGAFTAVLQNDLVAQLAAPTCAAKHDRDAL